jgi:hypothetical protein
MTVSRLIKVQHLEIEARLVQVHVASDSPVVSSTGPNVGFASNGVTVEQEEAAEESIVAAVSIIVEQQQDVVVAVHTLERRYCFVKCSDSCYTCNA